MVNTLKDFMKLMDSLVASSGLRHSEVLSCLLDYIIGFADIDGKPLANWRLNKEQTRIISDMFRSLLQIYQPKLSSGNWYDIFGDIFMQYAGNKKQMGQCFTPTCVCDVMTSISLSIDPKEMHTTYCNGFGRKVVISDPTCGSGRLLLSAATRLRNRGRNDTYLIGEDLDLMCCKQTAVNIMLHGFYGEVVCHDTLMEPKEVRTGFIINEGLYPIRGGLPTIRITNDKSSFVATR